MKRNSFFLSFVNSYSTGWSSLKLYGYDEIQDDEEQEIEVNEQFVFKCDEII